MASKTNGWLPIGTLLGLVGLFLTIAVMYSDICEEVRANTEGRIYTIKTLEQHLEIIRQRLDRIEVKIDRLISDGNDSRAEKK